MKENNLNSILDFIQKNNKSNIFYALFCKDQYPLLDVVIRLKAEESTDLFYSTQASEFIKGFIVSSDFYVLFTNDEILYGLRQDGSYSEMINLLDKLKKLVD